MEIDRRKIYFPEGVTVHRAAELNGIEIPSLCSHKDLSPFGGCRLCMVEVDGQRGFPLACTTVAQEGMRVVTDTDRLGELRREVLKLILSEHPSSCLICEESQRCRDYQGTIRKAGVTSGCRFCPNDNDCELQNVIDKVGLPEIDVPILYHGFEPEHDDPFFDRDYNICILCGRCVRICQEVRGSAVLAFTYRGPKAKIGQAFGRSHRQAGCEFCGACVDVCPTGALADKVSKWNGRPEARVVSTCPLCPIGCQIELDVVAGRLSKAKAFQDPEVNDGQLCVKGRFCLPEATHHFARAKKPMLRKGGYFREVSWDEALAAVAERLRGLQAGEFRMLVSPDLTNESLFAAQKLVREGLGLRDIDSSARSELAGGIGLWTKFFSRKISIKKIDGAEAIIAVGLDSRFDFSVVGTRVRKALGRGAVLVTVDARESNLAKYTDHWLRPAPGREGVVLASLAERMAGRTPDLTAPAKDSGVALEALVKAADLLAGKTDLTVIIGPHVFQANAGPELAAALTTIAQNPGANILPLYFGANTRGLLELGVLPEFGPGGDAPRTTAPRPKVVYLVGEVPSSRRPDGDFIIAQDIYLPPFEVDVFLPAATFAEAGGTLINLEGRVQEVVQVEHFAEGAVTGRMRPDWLIFADLARLLRGEGMDYRTPKDVLKDIGRDVPDFPAGPNRKPRTLSVRDFPNPAPTGPAGPGTGDFLLVGVPGGYRYRGTDLSSKVGGLTELSLEVGFRMSPGDLASLGLASGDRISVVVDGRAEVFVDLVHEDIACPSRTIYFSRPAAYGGLNRESALESLSGLFPHPVRANVLPKADPAAGTD
jgi:predicted molibdopterin-dependent oxidoreductase YjgC